MKTRTIYKEIYLPHLKYKVVFQDMKYLRGAEIKGSGFTAITGDNECTIFIEDIENTKKTISRSPYVAHEVVHVLQILCEKFHMKAENEQEHLAYIAFYILEEFYK